MSARTFFKAYGQYSRTDDFYTSRTAAVEYAGLPLEARAPVDRTYTASGGGRLDRYVADDRRVSFEAGLSQIGGNMFATPIGRSQNSRVRRPWARAAYTSGTWNFSSYYDARRGGTFSLPSGLELFDNSLKLQVEGLRRFDLGPRGRLVGGAAFTYRRVDSADPAGVQTLFRGIESGRSGGVFGQFEYEPTSRLKAVVALRLDTSTEHDAQVSPKASVVYALGGSQTLRASYGRAFQAASFVEYFTRAPAAPPVALGALEQALAPVTGGVPLGLSSVPVLAVGNAALAVETVDAVEVGLSGVLGRRVVLSADYYRSWMKDFISTLLPQMGTSLGRINPAFGPYRPPPALTAQQAAIVTGTLHAVLPPPLFALLSNDLDGTPAFVAASFTNFGRVTTQGVDLGVQLFEGSRWVVDLNYAWFDFDVARDLPDDPVSSNSAPHRVSAGLMYTADPYAASVRYRWSDEFAWKSGVFRGTVPAFALVDAVVQRTLTPHLAVRIDVANLFDNHHYELFGGDILRRRALADLTVTW